MTGSGKLRGGCLCGHVRYTTGPPVSPGTVCHCLSCRRAAGSPAVAWFTVRSDNLLFEAGAPAKYRSSAHVTRAFCGRCGTPLTYRHDDYPDFVDVTMASLDEPAGIAPADQTWTSHRLAWMDSLSGLPEYPEKRKP